MRAASPSREERYRSLLTTIRRNEPISTPNLAALTGGDPKKIYGDCRALEDKGLLESDKGPGPKLLFCVDDLIVVTHDNYGEHEDHRLRFFFAKVKIWSLTDAGSRSLGGR